MIRVKICGITNLKDALSAIQFGADALGFVFYPKSPRYIHPLKAKKIIAGLPPFVSLVGVFVNEKEETAKKIARSCGLTALQFHGDENPEYCRRFKGYKIIKAFRVKDKESLKDVSRFKVDAYLFDAFDQASFGGTGKAFNWNLLKKRFRKPVILSGGLNPGNIRQAIKVTSPFAIDINSGVEASPGKKSPKLLRQIFLKIRPAINFL